MDRIRIHDLEVHFRVGVPDQERLQPQRLLLAIDLMIGFENAAATDQVRDTIDYDALSRRLAQFGEGRSWKLIETLATDLADLILAEFRPDAVTVEVRKMVLPNAAYVSATVSRLRSGA